MNYLLNNPTGLSLNSSIDWWSAMGDMVGRLADQDPAFVSEVYDQTERIDRLARGLDTGSGGGIEST